MADKKASCGCGCGCLTSEKSDTKTAKDDKKPEQKTK